VYITIKAGKITATIDRQKANLIAGNVAERLTTSTTRRTFNRANVLTPVDTGNLRANNRMRVRRLALSSRGEVYNIAKYARAVHDGTGPHIIRARNRRALRFQLDGRVVYARWVRHPGTRARPFLSDAGRDVAAQTGFLWVSIRS